MSILTLVIGVILFLLGLVGYMVSEFKSLTALIPSGIGLLMVVAGIVALKESLRKHSMHAASVVALIGAVGSSRGIMPFIQFLGGQDPVRPMAVYMQFIMFILCVFFLIAAIRSFVVARIVTAK